MAFNNKQFSKTKRVNQVRSYTQSDKTKYESLLRQESWTSVSEMKRLGIGVSDLNSVFFFKYFIRLF